MVLPLPTPCFEMISQGQNLKKVKIHFIKVTVKLHCWVSLKFHHLAFYTICEVN